MQSINFTVTKKKFCLSLYYNTANSYLFVNGTKIYKFKAKDSQIVISPLCLRNIPKDWSGDNIFMILVLIMMLLMLMILLTFTNI